jgi:predicted outer membrane lipoprotein
MDYQARLNEILEKVRKGGVYDVMPEYERQSDYLDTDEAQEVITALFLESLEHIEVITALFLESLEHIRGHTVNSSLFQPLYADPRQKEAVEDCKKVVNAVIEDTVSKWQTNQEDGE